ncbi:MAG: hypothetical protein AAB706_02410, partial [Patescibacteria group bacterium]
VTLILSCAALVRFSSYYEIIFLGFVFDCLYATPLFFFPHFPSATVLTFFLLAFSFFIKKYLRMEAGV